MSLYRDIPNPRIYAPVVLPHMSELFKDITTYGATYMELRQPTDNKELNEYLDGLIRENAPKVGGIFTVSASTIYELRLMEIARRYAQERIDEQYDAGYTQQISLLGIRREKDDVSLQMVLEDL